MLPLSAVGVSAARGINFKLTHYPQLPQSQFKEPAFAVTVAIAAALIVAVVFAVAVVVVFPSASPLRHFDRSCSRCREQRSGETRFSTQPPPATKPLPLVFVFGFATVAT
jgi:hypothetical protein